MTARLAIGLLVAALIALAAPGVAAAEIFNVNTTADHDDKFCTAADCTLREAVQQGGSADTINLPAGNYVLTTSNELVLTADTIVGAGARTTFIDGGDKTRVLRVAGEGTSRVSGVTIRNGNGDSTTSQGAGGGIFQQSSTLMLTNVTVSGNSGSAIGGGGIVVAAGVMTMIGSTVSGNTAGGLRQTRAGGIYVNTGANALLANSTISGNTARDTPGPADSSQGGGIYAAGALTLINMTIAGNTAASGGGLYQQPPSAAGGPTVSTSMSNTILAGNSGAECDGQGIEPPSAITSHHDVVDDGSCMLVGTGDRQDMNPLLGALADNGGQTNTRALAVNSPAIDLGSGCAALDQRGVTRPGGAACDPGAFEFIPPTLRLTTTVVNDNGGTRTASGFVVHVKQGTTDVAGSPRNGNASGTTFTLTPGTFNVSVDQVAGYNATITGDCNEKGDVALAENQAKACTITLNDVAPTLTVVTNVVNDNGGTKVPADFKAHVKTGTTDVANSPQNGSAAGTPYTLNAGNYTVSGDALPGYTMSVSANCAPVALAVGAPRTCTITANDVTPKLTVRAVVDNGDGGPAGLEDFLVHVKSGLVEVPGSPQEASGTGTLYTLPSAGNYAVSGDGVAGYAVTVSGACAANGAITLAVGDDRACTVTFDDGAPTLKVITQVVTDNGGTRTPSDFSVHVKAGAAEANGSPQAGSAAGTTYSLAAGGYTVFADAVPGYTTSTSGDCAADGTITLAVGQARTCTVTANDDPPTSPPQSFAQQLPPPVAGKAVNLVPRSGDVKIKLPGTNIFVPLEEGTQLPVGTIVDALKGRVTLVAAANKNGGTATADFYGGIFKIGQTSGATPTTTLKLVEKLSCPKRGKASAAAKKKKRRLWGDGSGKFRTDGSYSSATVRGTRWLVEDSCKSTLTKVARGKVAVRDFVKKKTVIVKAGKKYTARSRG